MKSQAHTQRLLAINFGGLGDEVLFLPTLHSIKIEQPQWHITLLTEPRGKGVADISNDIDDSIAFDIKKRPLKPADYAHLLSLLRDGNFDAVLSSGSSPQVAMLLFLSGIRKRIGYGANRIARMLLTDPVALNRNQHAVFMYHDLSRGLGIARVAEQPIVAVPGEEHLQAMRQLLNANGREVVVLHPGTSLLAVQKGVIKGWAPANWARLIQLLIKEDVQVVLAGGPDDDATIRDIMQDLQGIDQERFVLAYGRTKNLRDLVALIHVADVLICVDSAPMHIGVGLNKPMVALFGPTDPAKLLWPSPRFIALRDPELAAFYADKDPFAMATRSGVSPTQQPFVQIPLDTVFQTTLDLLSSIEGQGS